MNRSAWFTLPVRPLLSTIATVLVLVMGPTPVRSQVACSLTHYDCGGSSGDSYAPADSGCFITFGLPPYTMPTIRWDFAAGTFYCSAQNECAPTRSLSTTALYAVTNLPAGTPVLVRFRLTVEAYGTICSTPDCYGAGGGNTISISGPGGAWTGQDLDGMHAVDMQFNGFAGDLIAIDCSFYAWAAGGACGDASVRILGTLDFYDVPAGAVISPCLANGPTTARSATWGQLKVKYR